jgi:hypothetical protein
VQVQVHVSVPSPHEATTTEPSTSNRPPSNFFTITDTTAFVSE